jgi:hypothetical protein
VFTVSSTTRGEKRKFDGLELRPAKPTIILLDNGADTCCVSEQRFLTDVYKCKPWPCIGVTGTTTLVVDRMFYGLPPHNFGHLCLVEHAPDRIGHRPVRPFGNTDEVFLVWWRMFRSDACVREMLGYGMRNKFIVRSNYLNCRVVLCQNGLGQDLDVDMKPLPSFQQEHPCVVEASSVNSRAYLHPPAVGVGNVFRSVCSLAPAL